MKQVRVSVRVEGRVQGVGFRHFTYKTAVALGLTGWVRNLADGSVEAVAEGAREQVDRWLEELHKGPPASRVQGMTVRRAPGEDGFEGFEVRF